MQQFEKRQVLVFPLWRKTRNKSQNTQKGLKPSPIPLKRSMPLRLARDFLKKSYIKGIPEPAFETNSAGMTVEAALLLPLFLTLFLQLMSATEMVRLHGNVQAALWENGGMLTLAEYVRMLDLDGGGERGNKEDSQESILWKAGKEALTEAGIKSWLVREIGAEYLEESPLSYGAEGIALWESSWQGDLIDIKVTYQVSPFFRFPGMRSFRMANRYYARAWTGYDVERIEAAGEGESVYVTTYGQVYHVNADCSYLKRQIEIVEKEQLEEMMNRNQVRYSICELCKKRGQEDQTIWSDVRYITPEGKKYHLEMSCSVLRRIVQSMTKQEAMAKYPPCSNCSRE